MNNKIFFAISTFFILTNTVNAAPANHTVETVDELVASDGQVIVSNDFGIRLLNKNFIYSGDVRIIQTLDTPVNTYGTGINVFNSTMKLGKTDLVVDFADGATGDNNGNNYISGIKLKNGSPGPLPPELAQTVTAEFGADSTITINGNNDTRLIGVNIEAGPYSITVGSGIFIPDMTAYLNENTTVTLNNAGHSSVGLYTYLSGARIKTKDGLVVNVNTDYNSTAYGIRAQGFPEYPTDYSVVELDGTATINMVNGGDGTAGILAHSVGSMVTGSKLVTVNNTTDDSTATATLYGLYANAGDINFSGPTIVNISGGNASSSAVAATSGGSVTLTGATISAENANAFYAKGPNSILTGNAAQYDVIGNIQSSFEGTVNLSMTEGSTLTGQSLFGEMAGTTNLTLSGASSIWNMTGDSVLTNLTLEGATLRYSNTSGNAGSPMVPKMLTVEGDYSANNGTLVLNSVLSDDASLTDKLVVKGDTSGHTNVVINNLGGSGALTAQGIEIVMVGGDSLGTFGNHSPIVAGAYDYFVRSGSTIPGADAKNWYLVSMVTPSEPEEVPNPNPIPTTPVYRVEAGSYLANLAAANTLFVTTLHDRLGETQYTDALTGEQKVTSLWLRQVGGHNSFRDNSSQLKTTSNRYVMQLGGDLAQWSNDDLDRWHLGVMTGYANSQSKTHSNQIARSSTGKITGYSVGLYGTWYANNIDKTGAYVDSWVLYNWFDNDVNGAVSESYKSHGVTASVESGYSFLLGKNQHASYWLQPKAQVVWMGVNANEHSESNGTRIQDDTDSNLMTRLGLRAYMNGHSQIDDGKDRQFQPFIEMNWIHNTENYSVLMDDVRMSQNGAKNIGELKLGIEGQLSNNLHTWGNVGQQLGNDGYSDTALTVGLKYSF